MTHLYASKFLISKHPFYTPPCPCELHSFLLTSRTPTPFSLAQDDVYVCPEGRQTDATPSRLTRSHLNICSRVTWRQTCLPCPRIATALIQAICFSFPFLLSSFNLPLPFHTLSPTSSPPWGGRRQLQLPCSQPVLLCSLRAPSGQ